MMYRKYNDGTIEVITGSMFAGKSEELIRRIKLLGYGNTKTLVVKPSLDTRWLMSKIVSRSGSSIETVEASTSEDILKAWDLSYKAVAIDEAQFFDAGLVDVITTLANKGVRVVVSCLDQDFEGKPFGFIPNILAIAEHVDKLSAVCMKCGTAASMTFRKGKSQEQIEVGDAEYEARCRSCHFKGQLEKGISK